MLYVRQLRVLAVGRAEGPKPDVARFIPLPMVGSDRREVLRTRDLARGWKVVSFWGSHGGLDGRHRDSEPDASTLVRSIRSIARDRDCLVRRALPRERPEVRSPPLLDRWHHLAGLALVGLVNLGGLFHLDWESYVSAFWLILLGSVLMECAVGSYPLTSREQRKSR